MPLASHCNISLTTSSPRLSKQGSPGVSKVACNASRSIPHELLLTLCLSIRVDGLYWLLTAEVTE